MRLKSVILLLLASVWTVSGQEPALPQAAPPAAASAPSPEEAFKAQLAAYTKGDRTTERLAELLPQLADPARRNAVRTAIDDPFPASALAGSLRHASLAVRLGALDLLEEKAGGDFGFNPWAEPASPENEAPLARWGQWSASTAGKPEEAKGDGKSRALLSDDQRRGYLRDLLGQDNDKATRARHMLEADGYESVGFLEEFLKATPALPPGGRAQVRQAQYQIVLAPRFGPGTSEIARNLAFGSRDQVLAAIATVKEAGPLALPILRDFISHDDPLVRETAIDSILAAGGPDAVPLVAPVLEKEPDVNVIHGALRRLKDIPGAPSAKLAASYLHHPDEDLLVSAIQACLKLAGGDSSRSMFGSERGKPSSNDGETEIIATLSDPRWRVRVAALEYIGMRHVSKASDAVVKLLDDPDTFVRFAAIKASAALGAKSAAPKLKTALMADESMVGPVLEGYAALKMKPDREMIDHLAKASPEARIAAIRAAETDKDLTPIVLRFAADSDTDVACAALRFLGSDDDRVKQNEISSALVQALRSGQPERRIAVLGRLKLPEAKINDPAVSRLLGIALESQATKTSLDPLYDGFLKPLGTVTESDLPGVPAANIPAAQAALITELSKIAAEDAAAESTFSAALALARAGHPEGYRALLRLLPGLNTARKAAIAGNISSPSHRDALPLLATLLRDPIEEIRSAAAYAAFSNENAPAFTKLVLDELSRPETPLRPYEVYSYHFESVARSQSCGPPLRVWAGQMLDNRDSSSAAKILACIAMREAPGGAVPQKLVDLARGSSDPWVRRAASQTVGWSKPSAWKTLVTQLAADASPFVREVVPAVVNRNHITWLHHFDDVHETRDNRWSYSSSERPPSPDSETVAALERLSAASEVSASVRFNALFALMVSGKPIDVEAMVQLLRQQPEHANVDRNLADWFEKTASQVGPGLRPLFSVIDTDTIDVEKMAILRKRLNPKGTSEKFPTSFADLSSGAPATTETQQVAPAATEPAAKVERKSLPVVFFFKPGCQECAKTREMLKGAQKDFATLVVEEHNILEADAVVLNQALCERFRVPSLKHNIAPSVFTQSGYLITTDIELSNLLGLIAKTANTPQDDAWKVIAQPQIEEAKQQVTQRYQALTVPVVIGAGLLDGVNPCAFATIIFFLSYLQIARRTPREMLLTGAAFILGVFLAYLAAGLLLYRVLATLHERFSGIQTWLNVIFAALALLAAVLSFRDAMRARGGRLDEMTLQLPGFLKDRIRGVIRTGARARRFVIAAFVAGVVVSFLELACTGQVYAPIVYQIQQGQLDAVAMLVLYNLAFIVPLVVIFLLAYGGLRSDALIAFQKKHTFTVKLALAVLFLLLAAFILFGDRLLSH
ncbi:HEAT repeat domain-containing protein [Luteolibacter ambystomatis]|uniref:HEAT repeat domain-containing protein n=1 Tax=Luteolibacter ambystomatis TaxID=2824561 RepID=A0A975GA59_9BACT|nr:HEAT repeat domain-containing protein [Luteolibacter ambystomatis]QUE51355.1 HEAT repeat domain-containing protein [Luteolibacter ambystomatis]